MFNFGFCFDFDLFANYIIAERAPALLNNILQMAVAPTFVVS